MGKDIYDMIKPENEKKVIVEKNKVDKNVQKQLKKEEKKAKDAVAVKKESAINTFVSSVGKDAVVVFCIVATMIVLCLGIVFYYFFNVINANMATYKGGKVTRQEYELQYKLMASEMQYQGSTAEKIREDLVNNIVVNKLLVEKFNKEKITLSDDSNKLITDFEKNDEAIKQYTARGVTKEDLVKLYKDIVIAQQYSAKVQTEASETTIKDAIIAKEGKDANMNKYMTRHILFAFQDSSTGAAKDKAAQKKLAEEILAKAKNGEDFAALATANSDDTGTKTEGGKFDAVPDKEMVAPEYVDAMITLKPGQIYPTVVESQYGYHIIKLDSIEEGGRVKDSNVKSSYSYLIAMNMLKEVNVKLDVKKIEKVEKEALKYVGVGNATK